MTPHDPAHTWTWTGDRTLPDWLDRHHHWHTDRPVIHTTDGPRHLYDGWMVILWTDQAITVASTTVAERVYGPDGIAGRLAAAEKTLARIQAVADEHPAGIDTALIHAALPDRETATEAPVVDRQTAVVLAALHRSAEADVSRVIDLYERWVKAGPPPIGTPMSRWWDRRLIELHNAINPKEN